MSTTKRAFLNAGSIIAIIISAVFALVGLLFCFSSNLVTEDIIVSSYETLPSYTKVDEADGGYVITYKDDAGVVVEMSDEEVKLVVNILNRALNGIGWFAIILSVSNLIISILVLNATSKQKDCKGLTIALLVLSIFVANFLTMAFMIVALCLKNKPELPTELEGGQQA